MQRSKIRRYIGYANSLGTNTIHFRNPWVIAWWSAAFPGYGHFTLNKFLLGFILMIWEVVVNSLSHLNEAIYLSMVGEFNEASEVLKEQWAILYVTVYIFAIWDSYRRTVEMNQYCVLAKREGNHTIVKNDSFFEFNNVSTYKPSLALGWSLLLPGLGHLYLNRLIGVVYSIGFWLFITYQSKYYQSFYYILIGDLQKANAVADPQWLLFIPSVYAFFAYDAYIQAIEMNRLFKIELDVHLKKRYQDKPKLLT